MKPDKNFIRSLQRHCAQVSITTSAVRNQGAKGLIAIARNYAEADIKLSEFFRALRNERTYRRFLDHHTNALVGRFPPDARSWGAARKALNLFFRELVYNAVLAEHFGLPREFSKYNAAIQPLEIPLDKEVGTHLYRAPGMKLKRWTTIKSLTPERSDAYQRKASIIAQQKNLVRIHLDLDYWRAVVK